MMEEKQKIISIAGIAALLIAGGVGFWYLLNNKQAPSSQEAPTLGSQIFEKTQNPLSGQVPDTNPFKGQKNPLDVIYKNPFE